jgi:chaperonin GroES
MRAVGGRVFVRPVERDSETAGGLYIPDRFRRVTQEGVVVAVGRGYLHPEGGFLEMDDLQPGSRVVFEKHKGQLLMVQGQELRVLEYTDIVAVVGVATPGRCAFCDSKVKTVKAARVKRARKKRAIRRRR